MKGYTRGLQILWLVFLLAVPLVLWILPATFFDNGDMVLCPTMRFFDYECYGCGMTRAFMHFHHFQFTEAIYYNWGVLWAFPMITIIWLLWTVRAAIRLDFISLYNSDIDLFRRIHIKAKEGYGLPIN